MKLTTIVLSLILLSLEAIGQVVPTITSLSPISGRPLQSLTIGGSGMSNTPSDHKVFIGGMRASVSSSGEGSVTVSVPYGAQYGPVQVSTLVGKTTFSHLPFIPSFTGGDFNSSSFATRQTISHETQIRGMNVGDLDGDGKPDLIVGNYEVVGSPTGQWYLSIYPNTSSGSTISFGSVVHISSLAGISKIYTADMNCDGKLDVVTVNELESSYAISIFRNTSTGSGNFSFTRVTDFSTNFTVNSVTFKVEDIAIGDLDKDGYLDIGAIYNLQYFRIILNSESGTWSTPYQESDIGEPVGIEFVDLNSDGKLDIAIPNAFSDTTWRMYINNSTSGSISLAKSTNYPGGSNLGKVYQGDFDKDNRTDLLVADANLYVHRKTSSAFVFDSPVTLTAGSADYVAMGDVDGDTKPDLVISHSGNTVRVFRNQSTSGSISFAAGVDFAAGGGIQKPRLADLNADGKPEIILNHVTSEDNTISILKNVLPSYSLTQTVVEVSNDTVQSGSSIALTLSPRENLGQFSGTSGLTVVFSLTGGGTSTGSISATTPGAGTYTATFTGITAGTSRSISATINGETVTSTLPTITVIPGPVSLSQSMVSVQSDTIVQGQSTLVTLQAKDSVGNSHSSGGLTVAFMLGGGGTSSGSFGSVNDLGNGTYTATFTGTTIGTPRTILATIGGDTVISSLPTMTVQTNVASAAQSTISVSPSTFQSGTTATVTFQAKNLFGTNLVAGADIVTLFLAGTGQSSGTFGTVTDNGNGTYTAVLTGVTSGTARQIGATINSDTVMSALPSFSVTPGPFSLTGSTLTVSPNPVPSGSTATITFQARDAAGNAITQTGLSFTLGLRQYPVGGGGTSTGQIGSVVYQGSGASTAPLLGLVAGTASTLDVTVSGVTGGGNKQNALPLVTVIPGAVSLSQSQLTVDLPSIPSTLSTTIRLLAKDSVGNSHTSGGLSVAFTLTGGGSSDGSIGPVSDHGNGTYSALFTGTTVGTARSITATIGGSPVTSTLPTITVTVGPPTISSFNPSSDSAGTSVVISGTNFSSTLAQNVVFFGPVAATVNTASTTSLMVTVPSGAGYGSLTVVNLSSGLSVVSEAPFQMKFRAGGYINQTSVASRVDVASSSPITAVVAGDLDGDGLRDVVGTNSSASSVAVYRNTGSPGTVSFAAPAYLWSGGQSQSVELADIDGDGKLDIITQNPENAFSIAVLRNTSSVGSLSFAGAVTFNTASGSVVGVNSIAIADFNSDGKIDVASIFDDASLGGTDHRAIVIQNTSIPGSLSFASPVHLALSAAPKGVGAGDLDGDGRPELLVTMSNAAKMIVFRNTTVAGVLSFASAQEFTTPSGAYGVAVLDVTNDGKKDVVVASRLGSGPSSVFRNASTLGTVTLDTRVDFNAQFGAASVAAGDYDGDGIADLAVANENSTSLSLFKNTTSTNSVSFAASQNFDVGSIFAKAVLGDLDGDGKPDIAVSTATQNRFSVFRNTVGQYSPQQSSVTLSEDSVQSGSTVQASLQLKDINGINLNLSGQTVVFSLSGTGTSTGTFGSVTDQGNGLYTAVFTGGIGGTPKSVGASINSTVVISVLPTITVLAGSYSVVHSTLSAPANPPSINIMSAGDTLAITMTARDSSNNAHTFGGLDVQPFRVGAGTSNGTFVSTIDNQNGTYTIRFAGTVSGTTDSIAVTINGDTVQTPKIKYVVQPGAISLNNSIISVVSDTVTAGVSGEGEFRLTLRDAYDNLVTATTGTDQVQFFLMGGGTSSGNINHPNGGWADVAGPGIYYATFTGTTAGSPTPVGAVINGSNITSTSATITVIPGQISLSNSYVEIQHSTLGSGATMNVTLHARDTQNNPKLGDVLVQFTITTGGGSYGTVTYAGNGDYMAPFTGGDLGTKYISAQMYKNGIWQGITSYETVQIIAALSTPTPVISGGGSAIEINAGGYVSIPDATPLRMTNNFALEAWIYPTGSTNLTILDKGSYNYLFSFRPNGTTGMGFYTAQTGWIYSGGTVPQNQWSHVALVYQEGANGIRFYLNGSLLGTATSPATIVSNTGPVNIGRQAPENCNCNLWQGKLDEVRIWNVARTDSAIQADYVRSLGSTAGLQASYNMNAGSGSTLSDISGNGNNGTFVDAVSWTSSGAGVQSVQPVEPTLSWGSVTDAQSYRVQLSTDASFTTVVVDTSVASTSVSVSGLSLSTTYYWRVKAMSSYNASSYSTTVSFVTTSSPPGPPTAVTTAASGLSMSSAQLNGAVAGRGAVTTVRFIYGSNPGVYLDTLEATQSPLDAFDSTTVSATASGLLYSHTYYYRTIASNSYGDTQGSEVSFTTSAPPVLSQVAGSAMVFDGSNDYVSTSLSNLGGSEITIEYWFKGSNAQSAVRQQNGGDYLVAPWSNPPIHILSNDGGTGDGISAGSSIYDGQWHHVAMTWKQNTVNGFTSYLDGVVVGQRNSGNTPIPNMATAVYLGSYVGSGEFTSGTMDEIRIWSVARTSQQIREYMHRPAVATDAGLLAYWQMNEGSGVMAADSIGRYHGTLGNGPVWATSTIPFGSGSSASTTGFVSGALTLEPLAMTVVNPAATAVDITVTQVNTSPNTTQGILGIQTANQYWIVEVFGTPGGFSLDVTIKVSPGSFDGDDVATPANLRLYRRNANANGGWADVTSATAATDSSVTFSGVTAFGQFIIGRSTSPVLPLGSGTVEDPYQIASLGNLLWITSDVNRWNKQYIQTAHIDASETSLWNGGAGWSPIGNSSTKFTGSYNGQNHVISGLYIARGSTNDVGMFGRCAGSSISNVGLANITVSGSFSVGGLVGNNDGNCSVSKSFTTGSVSGTQYIGGLVGFNYSYSSISASYSSASVSGSYLAGGLVGGNYVHGSISNSYASGSTSAGDYAAGLVGYNYNESTITNSFSTGPVGGSGNVAGLVVWNSFAYVDGSFWDTQTSSQSTSNGGTGKTTAEMKAESTFTASGWDFSTVWVMETSVNNGYPSLQWQTTPTAPMAATNAVSNIGPASATFNGTVNPHNDSTIVRFLIGTTSGMYSDSLEAEQSPLTGLGDVSVSLSASNLLPGQTYYVRVAASNSYGYARGAQVSFTTPGIPWISSVPGSAISFDGTNDYVSVNSSSDLDLTNGTVELWLKPTWASGSLGTNPGFIANRNASSTRFSLHMRNNLDGIDLWNGSGAGTVSYAFTQGTWYHIAWVTSGGTSTLYVNGQLAGTTNTVFSSTTGLPITIGGTLNNEFFKGDMDEVRMWNVVRTAAQIRENMHKALLGTEVGLVAYWQFNEGSGTVVADSVDGHHGTLVNGAAWTASTIPFGAGSSTSVANFTSGSMTVGRVGITTSDPFDGPVDLTVTQVSGAPNTVEGTTGTLASRYWIIEPFGTPGTFSVDLTLYLESGSISATDIASPSGLKLYRRNSNSEGSWTQVATGSSATDSSVTFSGITSFSQFTISSNSSPLPVEIAEFTVKGGVRNTDLKWRTETETNNFGFEIERRSTRRSEVGNQTSVDSWQKAGFIAGHGTSSSVHEYVFEDKNVTAGRYAYRIKQIDNDGSFSYTEAVEVEVGLAPKHFTLSQNYPNPFNPTTTIEFTLPEDGKAILKVYDVLGREVVALFDGDVKVGYVHTATFDASKLASGVYFAQLQFGNQRLLRKMLMMK